jgi:hypothetical protein
MSQPIDAKELTVLRIWHGAIYLRIPASQATAIPDGCKCTYCTTHPKDTPAWDTLGIPLVPGARPWTLHAPEWRSTDEVKE